VSAHEEGHAVHRLAGTLGVGAVALFLGALAVFGWMTPDFSYLYSPVSWLGAVGAPYALQWNLLGFAGVGLLLAAFGLLAGPATGDRTTAVLLVLVGGAFFAGAIPVRTDGSRDVYDVLHVRAMLLTIGCWALAMLRLLSIRRLGAPVQLVASLSLAAICLGLAASAVFDPSTAVSERLLFVPLFAWTVAMSILLPRGEPATPRRTSASADSVP
jgi:hypothetical membrane protein